MIKENQDIIIKRYDDIEYLQYKKLLEFGINHAYTLKSAKYDFSAKKPEISRPSYEKIFQALELDINTLVNPMLNHTGNVRCIDKVMARENLCDVDGVITDKPGITLATTNADCILFIMYDPIKKVIADVHSGWRSTFQKIAEKALVKMNLNYGCNYEDIYIFISPCIRKCHFEVNEDVKDLCENIFGFTNRCEDIIEKGNIVDGVQKYNIDLVLINRILFKELGIKDDHIIDSKICSVCNGDKINSYRIDKEKFKLSSMIVSL